MILPYFLLYIAFGLFPILFSLGVSFTSWDGIGDVIFIGLANSTRVFTQDKFFYKMCIRDSIIGLIQWEQHGFELLPSARNGKIGLEYALRYQPDIILTDIKMPVMTGLDMIEEIRKREQDVKFILLTAYEELSLIHIL